MLIKDRTAWAIRIEKFVIENEQVGIEVLEERAVKQHNISFNDFDAILMLIKKRGILSATLTTSGIIYKKKKEYISPLLAERERGVRWLRTNYPANPYEGQESPFKICCCAIWRADDGDIYNEEKHGHRDGCDALVYPEEFLKQNPYGRKRKFNTDENTEVATS